MGSTEESNLAPHRSGCILAAFGHTWPSDSEGPAWRQETLARLDSFGRLVPGWDSYQAPPPNARARFNAAAALDDLSSMDFPPHRVAPSVEGGIALSWRKGDRDANIEFFNTGEVLTEMRDVDGMPIIEDVGSEDLRAALERIRDCMERWPPAADAPSRAASGPAVRRRGEIVPALYRS